MTSATMTDIFHDAVRVCPDRVYCKSANQSLTYSEAAKVIGAVGRGLGPTVRGRAVALALPNSAAFLISYFAVLSAGAYPVLVNYAHPDATVTKLLEGIDLGAVLSDRDIPGLDVSKFDDAALTKLVSDGTAPHAAVATPPEGIGAILFSGGTTGLPKKVSHTNKMLVAAVEPDAKNHRITFEVWG